MSNLYVTIGPVQGFVVQARRTRDLWSGSFLLSYLSGHAMVGARKAGGNILVPDIENDPLIRMIDGGDVTAIGSLPNAFEVDPNGHDPEDIAKAAENAFRTAWENIAEMVWGNFLAGIDGNGTRQIWDRQVKEFWEFNWAVGDGYHVLNARKSWRRQDVHPEGGDHCTMMGDLQELSGYTRHGNRDGQDNYWGTVRNRHGISDLDLREDERLCAIAFIKRFFPKVTVDAIGKKLDTENWPSTVYMAAVPWLKKTSGMEEELDRYFQLADQYGRNIRRPGISKLLNLGINERYAEMDGNFYFRELVEKASSTPLEKDDKKEREELSKTIGSIQGRMGYSPSPYYALLLMDGDSMGNLKRDNKDRIPDISRSLSSFSQGVKDVVCKYNGVTIYAGGDDVLAMLPTDRVIPCARELSRTFPEAFKNMNLDEPATISAGVVITHYHQPLLSVYQEAKYLLEEVAKDENGRNSIGVSVMKNSGKYLQWVSTWTADGEDVVTKLLDAVKKHQGLDRSFSSSLMYSIRDSLSLLTDIQNWKPGNVMKLSEIKDLELKDLVVSEMMRSRERTMELEDARGIIEPLLFLCAEHSKDRTKKNNFLIDGWFLVNFLAKHVVEVRK